MQHAPKLKEMQHEEKKSTAAETKQEPTFTSEDDARVAVETRLEQREHMDPNDTMFQPAYDRMVGT